MKDPLKACWHSSIKEISKDQWISLRQGNIIPFYQWDWLNALEFSESISSQYGWQPLHLSLWENNKLIAFAPLYLKNHSFGEFIFDQEIARLAEYLGFQYYPKLIGMSPLSPIEGYKFFIANDKDEKQITEILFDVIENFARENGIFSCNFLYVDTIWRAYAKEKKYLTWINPQTLWTSKGEKSFDDYLKRFNSNQRRNIKRERLSIKKSGLSITTLEGNDINHNTLELMYDLYAMHCSKWGEWGSKYLTKTFFQQISNKALRDNIILFNVNRGDPANPLAMSLCVKDSNTLWGRYWGSKEEIKNLHFETCFYSPISWSINNGIKKFDPGAGGSHKMRRGFAATPRFSIHRWYNKSFENIMRSWLLKVNNQMIQEINASNNEAPF